MPRTPLQGVSISQLADGYAGRAIDEGLNAIIADISERGDDGKPRKVTIELTLTPEGKGQVEIDVQVKTKVPAIRPPKTTAKMDQKAGGLIFNPDNSINPDQEPLPFDHDEKN